MIIENPLPEERVRVREKRSFAYDQPPASKSSPARHLDSSARRCSLHEQPCNHAVLGTLYGAGRTRRHLSADFRQLQLSASPFCYRNPRCTERSETGVGTLRPVFGMHVVTTKVCSRRLYGWRAGCELEKSSDYCLPSISLNLAFSRWEKE